MRTIPKIFTQRGMPVVDPGWESVTFVAPSFGLSEIWHGSHQHVIVDLQVQGGGEGLDGGSA